VLSTGGGGRRGGAGRAGSLGPASDGDVVSGAGSAGPAGPAGPMAGSGVVDGNVTAAPMGPRSAWAMAATPAAVAVAESTVAIDFDTSALRRPRRPRRCLIAHCTRWARR